MKRIAEVHQFEHDFAVRGDVSPTNPMRVTISVRYKPDENLASIILYSDELPLPPSLHPVGAPEACGSVHVEAVISGRLKELGAHRAGQLAEYVVGHITSVCDPGNTDSESQPGFAPRYDFPQSGAPAFLRSCAIESCGVPFVITDAGVKVSVADDISEGDGARFTPAEPQGEVT